MGAEQQAAAAEQLQGAQRQRLAGLTGGRAGAAGAT